MNQPLKIPRSHDPFSICNARVVTPDGKMSDDDLRGRKFNAFRNYVFSQATAMTLYHHYSTTGRAGLAEKLTAMIVPA